MIHPLYCTKKYKIYNADCLEYLKEQPDESIRFVITSPPYDNLRKYKGYKFDFEPIAKEISRCLEDGGVIIWNIYDATINFSETGTSMRHALYFMDECGLNLHDTMIFLKENPMPESNSKIYHQAWEYIYCFSKGKPRTFNPIMVPTKHSGKCP